MRRSERAVPSSFCRRSVRLRRWSPLRRRRSDRAVSELVILADGKRRTLRQARQASRFGGLHREHRHANRVYRMLEAACSGGRVVAVDEVDSRRIEEVEANESSA
jgi:hypothetical protein